ncbi:MAG: pyruvate kinase [Planctomycetia bacterium]|nr:pyruvate kinase [Planctomycetia bacterium]
MPRRTRIVATLGPATDRAGVLEALLEAGLDMARLNFAHGEPEEQLIRLARLRQVTQRCGRQVGVLADLPGPKLRALVPAEMVLQRGREVAFAAAPGVSAEIGVTEPELIRMVQPGQRILLDDGRLQLRAVRLEGDRLLARVEAPGALLPNKGVNVPDTTLNIPALTPRDHAALHTAARAGVDWLALSFVRSAEAAKELRQAARSLGLNVPILAKIERPEAVQRSREIIEAFDGIMVARGDLGVEIPLERVPQVQKRLIHQARNAGKPVLTATDMLDSMRHNPRPTRAEASDVANAIYDGTDAVMLSGETAIGQYPVEAMQAMDRIVRETEPHLKSEGWDVLVPRESVVEQITQGACALAQVVEAKAIVAPTYSGKTSQLVSRYRPRARIIAPVGSEAVMRQMMFYWGVTPLLLRESKNPGEDRLQAGVLAAFTQGQVHVGDLVVVLAGHPIEGGERVPTIRVVRIGEGGRSLPP